MNRTVVVGVATLLFVVGGTAALVGAGPIPSFGSAEPDGPSARSTTNPGTDSRSGSDPAVGSAASGAAATSRPTAVGNAFRLRVTDVSNCGLTCRKVTVALTNTADVAARSVDVRSTVRAGDQRIVQRTARAGRIAPGETVTRTVEVNAGFGDVPAIQGNGGYVTIHATVTSDRFRQSFGIRRKVL